MTLICEINKETFRKQFPNSWHKDHVAAAVAVASASATASATAVALALGVVIAKYYAQDVALTAKDWP